MQFRRFGSGCELAREYCVALCVHSFKEVKWRLLESRFGVSGRDSVGKYLRGVKCIIRFRMV